MNISIRSVKRMKRFNFFPFGLMVESSPVQRIRSPLSPAGFAISNSLRTTQLRTARPRVSPLFFLRRRHRLLGQNTHLAFLLQSSKRLLDHSIFEGVEGDNANPSLSFQDLPSSIQYFFQIFQLFIHLDAKGLKGAGGRINSPGMKSFGDCPVNNHS